MSVSKPQMRMLTGEVRLPSFRGKSNLRWQKPERIIFEVLSTSPDQKRQFIQITSPTHIKVYLFEGALQDRGASNDALSYYSTEAAKEVTRLAFGAYKESGRPARFGLSTSLEISGREGENRVYRVVWGIKPLEQESHGVMFNYIGFSSADGSLVNLAGLDRSFKY